MAIQAIIPNYAKYLIAKGVIHFDLDSFKIILMQDDFVFDPDTHRVVADVGLYQLPTENGYYQNTKVLTGVSITEDTELSQVVVMWEDAEWMAILGSIGPLKSVIIYDDTYQDDPIIMFGELAASLTVSEGLSVSIKTPILNLV